MKPSGASTKAPASSVRNALIESVEISVSLLSVTVIVWIKAANSGELSSDVVGPTASTVMLVSASVISGGTSSSLNTISNESATTSLPGPVVVVKFRVVGPAKSADALEKVTEKSSTGI